MKISATTVSMLLAVFFLTSCNREQGLSPRSLVEDRKEIASIEQANAPLIAPPTGEDLPPSPAPDIIGPVVDGGGMIRAPRGGGGHHNNKECSSNINCLDDNVCTQDICEKGKCINPPVTDTSPCSDGSPCTLRDVCINGVCVGTEPKLCPAIDACHVAGVCDPQTGVCTTPPADDNSPCSDGNACTGVDVCISGVCVGTQPNPCLPGDACHLQGVCDPQTGICSTPPAEDGTNCYPGVIPPCVNSFGCQAGVCVQNNKPNNTDCTTTCAETKFCLDGACVSQEPAPAPYCQNNDTSLCTNTTCSLDLLGKPFCSTFSVGCTNTVCQNSACNPATGLCENTPVDCNDNDPCTVDSCNPDFGCQHISNPVSPTCRGCESPADCFPNSGLSGCATWNATCTDNVCKYSAAPNTNTCPHINCSTESCQPFGGCVYVPIVCVDSPDDCQDLVCDPDTDQCTKYVTDTSICPYPARVCCETTEPGRGSCRTNCSIPGYCGCILFPQVPLP